MSSGMMLAFLESPWPQNKQPMDLINKDMSYMTIT